MINTEVYNKKIRGLTEKINLFITVTILHHSTSIRIFN